MCTIGMNVEQPDGWGAGTAPQVHRRYPRRRSECAATVMKTEDHLPVPSHLGEQFLSVEGQYVDRRHYGRLLVKSSADEGARTFHSLGLPLETS